VLQAQDGTFYGTDNNGNMIHFSKSGNVSWSVPNDCPQIARGVIGSSGITYDNQDHRWPARQHADSSPGPETATRTTPARPNK